MKNKLTLSILLTSLLASSAFAGDEGAFGLREEDADMARKTLRSIRTNLDDAMRKVSDVLYPNLQTYNIQTNLAIGSTTILMDLIGTTSGKVASNSRVSTSSFNTTTSSGSGSSTTTNSYKTNPYISRLAIIETGLRVQLKFISASTGVSASTGTTAKVPIFEPFFGKRIVMIPIFNVAYDGSGNVTAKDTEISAWECLSDADEGISTSGTTISEGMRSVVSMAGGDLGSCQFISASNLDTIWASI